jgi:hypothetical protein
VRAEIATIVTSNMFVAASVRMTFAGFSVSRRCLMNRSPAMADTAGFRRIFPA